MENDQKPSTTDNLSAQPLNLGELVSYQEGSIVSKTIMDKNAGSLTLFAFAEGQRLSEHTAPFDALVYLLEGEVDLTIAGNTVHAKGGEMVIMPANKPHALKAVKKCKMLLVMIRSKNRTEDIKPGKFNSPASAA
jgi:quercetin dioxygenase-like cupin family protein